VNLNKNLRMKSFNTAKCVGLDSNTPNRFAKSTAGKSIYWLFFTAFFILPSIINAQTNCCGSGKGDVVKQLTLWYSGDNCSASLNSQGSNSSCSGDPASDSQVYIVVNDKGGTDLTGNVYFAGNVNLDGTFTASSASNFNTDTYVHVYNQQGGTQIQLLKIKTNCSSPIAIGDQFGSMIVVDAKFKNGFSCTTPPSCPVCVGNLVTNGGFNSNTSGWTSINGNFSIDNPYPQCGTPQHAMIFRTSGTASFYQNVTSIAGGSNIKLTFWAGVHNSSYDAKFGLEFYNGATFLSESKLQIDKILTGSPDMQYYTINATVPSNATIVRVIGSTTFDWLKVDEVCLTSTISCTSFNPTITGTNSICNDNLVPTNLSVTGGIGTYLWSTGATTSSVDVTPSVNGSTYTVTVTSVDNCVKVLTKTILVKPCSGQICFNGANGVSATANWTITYTQDPVNDKVKIRATLSKNFVDNTYGTNAIGWGTKGHTFGNLTGSDHLILSMLDGNNSPRLITKLDYITASNTAPSGYDALGVTGGEGQMIQGSSSDVLSSTTSMDQNLNSNGPSYYGVIVNSPATNANYTPNPTYPNWIFDVWYEVEVRLSAFGAAGFGKVGITGVHASPSKTGNNTEEVTEGPCCELDVKIVGDSLLCSGETTTLSVATTKSLVINATEDVEIWNATDGLTKNYGSCDKLYLNGTPKQRSLLKFNISSIPANAEIVSAKLNMSKIGGSSDGYIINAHRITNSWTEGTGSCNGTTGTANYNQRSAGVNWITAGGDFNPSPEAATNVSVTGKYDWSVGDIVAGWRSGAFPNHGILLKFNNESLNKEINFASSENATAGNRPTLTVNYFDNSPPVAGTVTYKWSTGATTATINVNPGTTTTYTVTVTESSGCTGIKEIDITVNPRPTVDAGVNTNLCKGGTVILTAQGSGGSGPGTYTYTWDNPASTGPTKQVSPVATSTYKVTVTDANGCTNTDFVMVTVNTPPVSSATNDGPLTCTKTSVTLTANPSTGVSYKWTTGATTRTTTVSLAGTYTVTVTDLITECISTATTTVTGDGVKPIASAINNGPLTCIKTSVILTAQPATGVTYLWSGGGTNQTKTVTAGGTYTVTVTNISNGCSNTAATTVLVNNTSTAVVSLGPDQTICDGDQLVINSTVTGIPSCGNPGTSDCNHTLHAQTGWLEAPNTAAVCGDNAGTKLWTQSGQGISSITLNFGSVAPTGSNICIRRKLEHCNGYSGTTLSDMKIEVSINGSTWTTINNSSTFSNNNSYQDFCFTLGAGVSAQYIRISDNGKCAFRLDYVNVTTPNTYNTSISYLWSGPGVTGATTSSVSVNQSGTFILEVTDCLGCKAKDTVVVSINNNVIAFAPDITVCAGQSATLTATAVIGGTYEWRENASSIILSTSQTYTVTPTATKSYILTVRKNGCEDSDAVIVTVNPKPTVNLGADVTVNCTTPSATLTASGGGTYKWNTNATTASIMVTPTTTTTYTVTVTAANGCTATDNVIVTFNQNKPTPEASNNGPLTCTKTSVVLTAQPATGVTYLWSGGGTNQTKTVTSGGIYTVTVTNISNGCSNTAVTTVIVNNTSTAVVSLGPDQTICDGDQLVINSTVTGIPSCGNPGTSDCNHTLHAQTGWLETASKAAICGDNAGAKLWTRSGQGTSSITLNFGAIAPAGSNICIRRKLEHCDGYSGTALSDMKIEVSSNGSTWTTINNSSTFSNNTYQDFCIVLATGVTAQYIRISDNGKCAFRVDYVNVTTPNTYNNSISYLWSGPGVTGVTTSSVTVNQSGTYILEVTDCLGCKAKDTVVVSINNNVVAYAPDVTICAGQTATLTATEVTGGTYEWRENGSSTILSTSQTYTVTPTSTKSYILTVRKNGCENSDAVIVTVNPNPTVNLGADVTVNCTTPSATLTASGGGTYKWNTNATTASITVTPTTTTTYTVTVTTANGCTATDAVVVTADKTPPTADAGADVTVNCTTPSAILTASGGGTYKWNTNATTASITVTPTITTTYTVTVTAANGCTATDEVKVTADKTTPTANAGADVTVNCTAPSATLTASGGGTYKWNTNATTAIITVTPTTTTTYTVTVTAANGCTATDEVKVTADRTPPTADAGADVTVNCTTPSAILTASGGGTYKWNTNETTASITVNPTTTTTYTVTVTASNGCTATDAVVVTVDKTPPTANAGADVTVNCTTASATLTASGGGTYVWSTGATTQNVTVNPETTTTYSVTVTSINGCTARDEVIVTAKKAKPTASLTANGNNCITNNAQLFGNATGGTGPYTFRYTGPNNFTSNLQNPTIDTSGTYILTVTDVNGCTDTESIVIFSKVVPIILVITTEICVGESVTLTASGGVSYKWGANANNATTASIMVSPSSTSTYTVTVTTADGCTGTGSATITVYQKPVINSVDVVQNSSCNNTGNTGKITVNATGQPGLTLQYRINGGAWQPTNIFSNLGNGIYNVEVSYTTRLCTSDPVQTTISSLPGLVIVAENDKIVCASTPFTLSASATGGTPSYTYLWSNGATGNPVNVSGINANTTFTVTVTDSKGCSATDIINVTLKPGPSADISGPTQVCANDFASFIVNNPTFGETYMWTFDNGVTQDGDADDVTENVKWSDAFKNTFRTVTLKVTKDGCIAYDTVKIFIKQDVFLNTPGQFAVCQGGAIQIGPNPNDPNQVSPGATFVWTPNLYLNNNTVAQPLSSPPFDITYTLTATINGCVETRQVFVDVDINLNPIADAGPDKTICIGESVQIGGNPTATPPTKPVGAGILGLEWTPGNSQLPNPTVSPTTYTEYRVIVVSTTLCADTDYVKVFVEPKAKVGDFVWEDLNGNGLQDNGEPGINGVTVSIYNSFTNALVETTLTTTKNEESGFYQFEVCKGTYYIVFGDFPTYIRTQKDAGNDTKDSDANPNTGKTDNFSLNPGDDIKTIDAGYFKLATIGDFVWRDINANGIQDPGELGVGGITVNLNGVAGDNTIVNLSQVTSPNGIYLFTNLKPGIYTVQVIKPLGFLFSPIDQTTDDRDSDSDPISGTMPTEFLTSGEDNRSYDAGIYPEINIELDKTFIGAQPRFDGTFDVTYSIAVKNLGGPGKYSLTDNTGFDLDMIINSASFTSNAPGNAGPIALAGIATWNLATNQSIAALATHTYTLLVNVKLNLTDNIGDNIYQLCDVQSLRPERGLYNKARVYVNSVLKDEDDACGDLPEITMVKDLVSVVNTQGDNYDVKYKITVRNIGGATGNYSLLDEPLFDDDVKIISGSVTGQVNIPMMNTNGSTTLANINSITAGDMHMYNVTFKVFLDLGPNALGDKIYLPCLVQDSTIRKALNNVAKLDKTGDNIPDIIDYACGDLPKSSLGDFVWEDKNANGIQDAGEPGISGVPVLLFNADNVQIASKITDPNGFYEFTNLEPGNYGVRFVKPQQYIFSLKDQGLDDKKDSDADPNSGLTDVISLSPGERDTTIDAGLYRLGSIGDLVWEDENADGIKDVAEFGIPNVTVNLSGINGLGVIVNLSTVTNNAGLYLFPNLVPGNYTVTFVRPSSAYKSSPANAIVDDARDSDANPVTGAAPLEQLESGENNMTIDAGYYRCSYVGDYVWIDQGPQKDVQDLGDLGINGVRVELYSVDAPLVPVDIMTTANNPANPSKKGYYLFEVCKTGMYFIKVIKPSEYDFVTPNIGADKNLDSDIIDFPAQKTLIFTVGYAMTITDIDAGLKPKVLPVTLKEFTGNWNQSRDINELTWITLSEVNNDYFEIERSVNGSDFVVIAKVKGKGNSSATNVYNLDDSDISWNGEYTYRLRQVDFDGKVTVFDPIKIRVERKGSFKTIIYPNPTVSHINIEVTAPEGSKVNVDIYDNNGRLILKSVLEGISEGKELSSVIEAGRLSKGVYHVMVNVDGTISSNKLIVIE
jgi:hypothetical protein